MSHKIMIVDDEPGIRESLKEYFEIQDLSTVITECGEEALKLLDSNQFDLILSDVRMPKGDGRFLLREVKKKNIFKPLFLLMSGFTDLTVEEAGNEGAAALFIKPFNPVQILETIKKLLLPPGIRWQEPPEQEPTSKIQIAASDLLEGSVNSVLSCGHLGFFLPTEATSPKVGEMIRFNFQKTDFFGTGLVKWTRDYEQGSFRKGYGVEFQSMSPKMILQLDMLLKKNGPIAMIPSR